MHIDGWMEIRALVGNPSIPGGGNLELKPACLGRLSSGMSVSEVYLSNRGMGKGAE